MGDENSVFIVSACRTAIGSLNGIFKDIPAHELGAVVIAEALKRAKVKPVYVSEVIMGQCLTGGQGQNPARQAALKAGIPNTVPAYGVNMVCGSGLKSIQMGFQAIKAGDSRIVIAGGQESMSMANHCAYLRRPIKYGNAHFMDSILMDGLTDQMIDLHMGDTAEILAQRYEVTREMQDEYALSCQEKTNVSLLSGHFVSEIVPVRFAPHNITVGIGLDEFPKPETTLAVLKRLKTVFNGGPNPSVTAGNSSGINDGAAAVLLASKVVCDENKLRKMAKIVSFGQAGVDPVEMGLGPVPAIHNALEKAGWTIDEVDLFEINEAFAVQTLLVIQKLGISEEKVNVIGGSIALGHPIGCSGTRILVTLIYNLQRDHKKRGVASLCIGGGMGIAICIELVEE